MLFKSKLTKVEAFVNAKADDRTPDMLAAAQAELDGLNANVIMVPKTDTIKSAGDLQNHVESLEKAATDAKAEVTTAKAEVTKVQGEMQTLKSTRVLGSDKQTSDKGTKGDDLGEKTAEEETSEVVHDATAPWNAAADELGLPMGPTATEEKPKTEAK